MSGQGYHGNNKGGSGKPSYQQTPMQPGAPISGNGNTGFNGGMGGVPYNPSPFSSFQLPQLQPNTGGAQLNTMPQTGMPSPTGTQPPYGPTGPFNPTRPTGDPSSMVGRGNVPPQAPMSPQGNTGIVNPMSGNTGGSRFDPAQYQDATQRAAAWRAAGSPAMDFAGNRLDANGQRLPFTFDDQANYRGY